MATLGARDTVDAFYSGIGYLDSLRTIQRALGNTNSDSLRYSAVERPSYDGLGNVVGGTTLDSVRFWLGGASSGPTVTGSTRTVHFIPGVGRDTLDSIVGNGGGVRKLRYDEAGNVVFSTFSGGMGTLFSDRASFYDAAGQLVAADARFRDDNPLGISKSALEEYRYDALGRRIWVRSLKTCGRGNNPVPAECLASSIRRIVWDGAQELAEIQVPGGPGQSAYYEQDVGTYNAGLGQYGEDTNPYYGRVIYTFGTSIDQPLSVARYAYSDYPSNGSHTVWPDFVLHPYWDLKGAPSIGAFSNGAAFKQLVPGGTQCVVVPATSPQRCVPWNWQWGGAAYNSQGTRANLSWQGSLLVDKQDAAGTMYRRNRVYDPYTSRFTQEDPIGLAGGLNLYGYANGDPVNFSDPFGLCVLGKDCWQAYLAWRQANMDRCSADVAGCMMSGFGTGTLRVGGVASVAGGSASTALLRAEFNAVRGSYWKNEALNNAGAHSADDITRMRLGKAPIGEDGFPVELHHKTPLSKGGKNTIDNLEPKTRTDHRLGENYKKNHPPEDDDDQL
ncbi:MAG: RHS repeat-associated core domain-containing protein [Gemmatimonadota bacterium]